MTTLAAVPAASSTRLRLTARGRRALALLASMPIVVAVAFAVLSGGSAAASRDAAPAPAFEEVTVMTGETLWSIAQDVAPGADPRDVVDEIVRLNALDGVTVSAGQRLSIPAEYSAAS
jgi:Tfp pilus assembly protein FimV